jgi:hypothetical protein
MIIYHLPHKEKFDAIIFLLSRGLWMRFTGRPDMFVGSQKASIQQAHPTSTVKAVPESVSSRFGACNSLQGDILLDDAQVNAAPVQEPVSTFRERNGEIGVTKFLAMKKGGRR